MIVLIDGYNLLKRIHGVACTEKERSAFVNLMGNYVRKRIHNKVLIFFDAGPCVYPQEEKQKGIPIFFSGEHKTADDLIMEYITEHKNKELLVVTYDREIKEYARAHAIETIEPELFYQRVKTIIAPTVQSNKADITIKKLTQEEDPELDYLMHSYSKILPQESYEHDENKNMRIRSQTMTKKEKREKKMWEKL